MAQQALIPAPEQPVQSLTPMDMLAMAVQQNASIERLSQLMDLQQRWEASEARKAFIAAMAGFKSEHIRVRKDKDNHQYKSKYVSLGNLVDTVTPFLSKHNLSVSWDIDQTNGIKVTCIITHSAGHSEKVAMTCPPDKSGAKNPIQEIKSAITYAKACTFESICGLASTDANVDDDGNGAGASKLDQRYIADRIDLIENANTGEDLFRLFSEGFKVAKEAGDKQAQQAFIAAKDARKKALCA